MPVPHHAAKHRSPSLFRAADFHRYVAKIRGRRPRALPRTIVLVFGHRWKDYLARKYAGTRESQEGVYCLSRQLGIYRITGPGAPFAAMVLEELAALGTRNFVILGIAGALQPDLPIGSLVLCTKALRDEGTSHHYARGGPYARASRELTGRLAGGLERARASFRQGPSWTTDAVYRETVAEVRRYRRAGILTVEMEASAVFTIARHLKCQAAALFVISDYLADRGWRPGFHDTRAPLRQALQIVVGALGG